MTKVIKLEQQGQEAHTSCQSQHVTDKLHKKIKITNNLTTNRISVQSKRQKVSVPA
jgi:hypothetical protein